jgi:hypothetical protein
VTNFSPKSGGESNYKTEQERSCDCLFDWDDKLPWRRYCLTAKGTSKTQVKHVYPMFDLNFCLIWNLQLFAATGTIDFQGIQVSVSIFLAEQE